MWVTNLYNGLAFLFCGPLNCELCIPKKKGGGHQQLDMWDSSSEGSCHETTTSRRKDRRPLTATELEIFDKEMEKFFKN